MFLNNAFIVYFDIQNKTIYIIIHSFTYSKTTNAHILFYLKQTCIRSARMNTGFFFICYVLIRVLNKWNMKQKITTKTTKLYKKTHTKCFSNLEKCKSTCVSTLAL